MKYFRMVGPGRRPGLQRREQYEFGLRPPSSPRFRFAVFVGLRPAGPGTKKPGGNAGL